MLLRFHDVAEYVHQEVPHPPFYIQHLLPVGGSLLLAGKPGVMKSWTAQDMSFHIAAGIPWLDLEVRQGRCALINFEISEALYHDRLVLMSQTISVEPEMLIEASPSYLYLDEQAIFNVFKEEVLSINPNVLVLDCLSGCFGGDENSSRDVSLFLKNLEEFKSLGISIILIQHTNKNPLIISPMDKVRGHSKLPGWADSVLYLDSQPSGIKQIQFAKTRLYPFGTMHSKNIIFENYTWRLR